MYICSGGRNVTTIFIFIFIGMEKDIEVLESEVKELRSEFVDRRSELMELKLESTIEKKMLFL